MVAAGEAASAIVPPVPRCHPAQLSRGEVVTRRPRAYGAGPPLSGGQSPLGQGPTNGDDTAWPGAGLDEVVWRVFAPLVAARPVMRVSGDGGSSYPLARRLSVERPAVPAAVATFDAEGRASNVVFDLDVSKGGPARVAADAERLAALLAGVGAAYVVDESPSGGLHVHVPLAEPAEFAEVARVMRAAKALFVSLDRAPMSNRKTGCIRPPGAAHRLGGSQRLVTGFEAARRVFLRRNRVQVWRRLLDRLAPADPSPPPAPVGSDLPRGPRRGLSAGLDRLARTGVYPAGRYASDSEARQAVLTGAAGRGWSLDDVVGQVAAGRWPGLRGFYSRPRYRGVDWTVPLGRDWATAERFVGEAASLRERAADSDTSENLLTRPAVPVDGSSSGGARLSPGEDRFVRRWHAAVGAAQRVDPFAGRVEVSVQVVGAVLAGLGRFGQRCGSQFAVGVRSLSLAAGVSHETAAVVLRYLREQPDPFVVFVEPAAGVRGDRYELRIPDRYLRSAYRARWVVGAIPVPHPVFRARGRLGGGLGLAAGAVYAALSDTPGPVRALAAAARVGEGRRLLVRLAEHGLAVRGPGGWIRGPAALDRVADRLGVGEYLALLAARYRADRAAYHGLRRRLDERTQPAETVGVPGDLIDSLPAPDPPPDPDTDAAVALVRYVLGGQVIEDAAA